MDFDLIRAAGPELLAGAGVTLLLTAFAIPIGFVIAWSMALARLSNNRWLAGTALTYSYVFRGTPLVVQLYLAYYGLGQFRVAIENVGLWWLFRDPVRCSLLVLSLNTAAYSTEIFRGAIAAVGKDQTDACLALGLSWWVRVWRVIVPQALRLAWPAYTNEVVFLMQATSLVSLVAVTDLFRAGDLVAIRTFRFYLMYGVLAAIYLVFSYAIIFSFGLIEQRLTRHATRGTASRKPPRGAAFARLALRG